MRTKNKIILVALALFQLLVTSVYAQSKIDMADKEYRNCNYQKANKLYLEIWKDINSSNEDKVSAGKKLAYLSWQIKRNIDDSRKFINSSIIYKIDEPELFLELSNYELECQNYDEALQLCKDAVSLSENSNYHTEIYIQEAKIILEEAINKIKINEIVNNAKLNDGLKKISEINLLEPGRLDVNEIQLGLALLLNNGDLAYNAWKGYFRVPKNESAKGILLKVDKNLASILANWKEDLLSDDQRNELIFGLANSRFYHYAYLVEKVYPSSENSYKVNDIMNYYSFCESVNSLSENYFRNIAINNTVSSDIREKFYKDLNDLELVLWDRLSWNDKAKKFTDSNFKDELYKRFGTIFKDVKPYYTNLGKTGLFLFAHTIADDEIIVKQYGYEPTIHFVNLDFMYANSYDGWFIGSKTGRLGGWNEKSLIVQMRRAYSDRPVLYWNKISNVELKKEWEESIFKLSQEDDKIAAENPYVYLPGLVNRMRYNASLKLIDSLGEKGLTGNDLRMAFISKFEELSIQSSIIAHEGRHAIDSKYRLIFEPTCKDFEYRAKLSEVIFSEDPLFTFAFGSVYRRNLTSKSKHSRGSRKVVVNLVNWMDKNKNNIKGFDTEKPTLTQLDLLSEEQFLSAFKAMDPLVKKRGDIEFNRSL